MRLDRHRDQLTGRNLSAAMTIREAMRLQASPKLDDEPDEQPARTGTPALCWLAEKSRQLIKWPPLAHEPNGLSREPRTVEEEPGAFPFRGPSSLWPKP
jgi:hypothetical protein